MSPATSCTEGHTSLDLTSFLFVTSYYTCVESILWRHFLLLLLPLQAALASLLALPGKTHLQTQLRVLSHDEEKLKGQLGAVERESEVREAPYRPVSSPDGPVRGISPG